MIHFKSPHQKEYLVIQSLDGKRTGHFTLYIEGDEEPFALMIGEFVNGRIEGYCEVYDEEKGKVFEGTWVDGKRCGTCIECDFGNVSFQGAYRNDKRNGYGWEYHNNELQREGIWVDGVYQTTYFITKQVNFSNSGLGMTITRKDNDLQIITCPWEENRPNGKAYAYSVQQNKVTKSLLYLHGDAIEDIDDNLPTSFSTGTLVFPSNCYWKGSIANGEACGEGSLFSPDGQLLYKGTMFRNMRYGTGQSYVNGQLEYDGMWSFDVRMGNGTSFVHGKPHEQGVFIDDMFAYPTLDLQTRRDPLLTHVLLRVFRIGDHLLNDIVEIDFTQLALLEELAIGDESLKELNELNVTGLQCLRSLQVGRNALTQCITLLSPANLAKDKKELVGRTISNNEQRIRAEMKRFVVARCPALQSIVLKQGACSDFYACVIEGGGLEGVSRRCTAVAHVTDR